MAKKTQRHPSFLYALLLILAFLFGILIGLQIKTHPLVEPSISIEESEQGYFIINPTKRIKATVWYVIDGDTIALSKYEHVRLLGIDAPEHSTDRGVEAQLFLQKMVQEKEVEFEFDQIFGLRDQYGRLLAYVFIDGQMANLELLKADLADMREDFLSKESKYLEEFRQAD